MNASWLNPRRRIIAALNRRRKAGASMSSLMMTFLLTVFGLALTPTIGDQVWAATRNATGTGAGNITGAAAAIINQVPLVWVFLIVGIAAAAVVDAFESL